MTVAIVLILYFAVLMAVSRFAGRGGNDAFFRGNRRSPWPVVALGMIGASLSGVTFVSVPGMVLHGDMTYLQMVMGFFFGYLIVAFVLVPLYYRYNLTSIYGYLADRFGPVSRKTGAWFFILSKLTGAAARLYLVCLLLEMFLFADLGVPYWAVAVGTLALIWLYTRRSGVRTLVWTDALQTVCLLAALVLILIEVSNMAGSDLGGALRAVWDDPHSRVFEWDWHSPRHFLKQFLSGIFIVVVMTGLDQDMMQKNLTCRNLRDARKNLCSYGAMFLPVNFLFLALGVILIFLYAQRGMPLPEAGDSLLPGFIGSAGVGEVVLVCFAMGIVASAFSSADSATTSLTTSFCVDILGIERPGSRYAARPERTRKLVHLGMTLLFVAFILGFRAIGSTSVIDAIYVIAGYTYGPLLGLFAFGMTTRRRVRERWVPLIAVASPLLCYALDSLTLARFGYKFGYELLLLNALLTYLALLLTSTRKASKLNP